MTKPSETPTEEPKPSKMNVPKALLFQLVDAVRAADKDSRRTDRSLHDETRDKIADAVNAWADFQDARMRGGR